MNPRFASVCGAICAISGASLLIASCSLLAQRGDAQHALPAKTQQQADSHRIVQLDFGRDAAYGICIEPACPTITPKTVGSPSPTPATRPAMLPTASIPVAPSSTATGPATTSDGASESGRLVLQFSSGASTLDAKLRRALDKLIPAARKARTITIMGRTDNVGPAKANQAIALARALEVREYLRSQMKDVNNVIAIDAKGACCFLSTNDTPHGRKANRRVEVVFTDQG